MKIGFFTDTYIPQINGVTVSLDNYTKELRKRGHVVYIFAPKIQKYQDKDPYVVRLPSVKILSSEPEVRVPISLSTKNLQAIYRLDLDIIHAHGNGAFSLLGHQVARFKGIPFVMTFHTVHTKYTHYVLNGKLITPRMVAAVLRVFGNLCDGIIIPSKKMEKELVSYGVTKPMKVIPNFIDFVQFQDQKKGYLRKQYAIPKNAQIILSVGRLGKEKNFTFVIKSFAKLAKRNKDAYLVLVGQGPLKKKLEALVVQLDLQDRIRFTDRIDTDIMPKVYADADIFVFASTTETQGICVLEAASSGLPLIVAKDQAYESIVTDGENGYMLALNQKVFAHHMLQLLRDAQLSRAFGIHSKQLAQKNFQPNACVAALLEFYQITVRQYVPKAKALRKINSVTFSQIRKIRRVLHKLAYIQL